MFAGRTYSGVVYLALCLRTAAVMPLFVDPGILLQSAWNSWIKPLTESTNVRFSSERLGQVTEISRLNRSIFR